MVTVTKHTPYSPSEDDVWEEPWAIVEGGFVSQIHETKEDAETAATRLRNLRRTGTWLEEHPEAPIGNLLFEAMELFGLNKEDAYMIWSHTIGDGRIVKF